jgi:hypothetical protein
MIDIPDGWATVLVALVGIVPTTLSAITLVLGRRVRKDAAVARHELQNNSGSSTRDAIDRIEHKLTADYFRIGALEHRLDEHVEQSAIIIRLLTKGHHQ